MILVTGGAGFIGSNFVLDWLAQTGEPVINLDKLTYAGNLNNLASLEGDARHVFVHGDICDGALVLSLLRQHRPRAIVHFAAESHVDRSIHGPGAFIDTNINGTFALLEAARAYWPALEQPQKGAFRFLHVSTDEVYGTLGPNDPPFTETSAYAPNSPYSASKAASDHDRRYAIGAGKLERELGWKPAETFESGIRKPVQWYLANQVRAVNVQSGAYIPWVNQNYAGREIAQ